ncbi:response regulator [soil metagenome]
MKSSVHVLLVEDNAADILLTREALSDSKISVRLSIAMDGEAAQNFLEKNEPDSSYPDLILLDINLPKINGYEVLQFIKKSEKYRHIPVIILTTSSSPKDIMTSYYNQANCYITKPVELDKFIETMHTFEKFWCSTVQLPPCP